MPVPAGGSVDTPVLFTQPELVIWAPFAAVTEDSYELALSLATTAIRDHVGAADYDALTDLAPLKRVALDLARRMLRNADGKRSTSRQIDDYTETDTYASETLAAADLTDDDRASIDRALGRAAPATAFTIRPAGVPDLHRARRWHW